MSVQGASERNQPEPHVEYAVLGTAELTIADFVSVWLHVPAARRARTVLLSVTPVSFFFALGLALIPELSWWAATIPLLVVIVPQACLSLACGWFARWRLRQLGTGPVTYRLNGDALALETGRGSKRLAWSELNGFLETDDAFVLYPKGASLLVVPKRAFEGRDAHVQWFLRRRLAERRAPHWGLRLALAFAGTIAFLCAWHFLSLEQPAPSPPGTPGASHEAAPAP